MPNDPPRPPRRLLGWRYKAKGQAIQGLPQRDIPLSEAEANPEWLERLQQAGIQRYYLPEYTKPERGQH